MEIRSRLLLSVNHESCLELAGEALDLAEKHGIYVRNNSIYSLAAAAALSINNLQMVRKFLKKMDALTLRTPRGLSNLNQYIAGWYYFLKGNFHNALILAEKGLEVSLEYRSHIPEILFRQLITKIHYEMGEYKTALLEVTRTKEIIAGMDDSPMLLYFSLFDEALVLFGLNKESAAEEALRSAMKIGVTHDYRTIMLYWKPAFLVELCKKSLKKEIETPYVRNLIRSLRLVPEKPPYEIEGWPWTVLIYTLGEFRIVCNGSPLEFPRKAQKKPLELLKLLLAFGGKGIREEAITDILWPESDGDAAHHSFEMNLKRLRDLLGHPETLQLRDRRLTLNDRLCWVDSWAFERFIKEMKIKTVSGKSLLAAQQAVDIYTGHFLSGETDTNYAISLRERLRAKYLSAIQWLGNQLEISGKWQAAAECYERGLEVDDLAEELYRRLIYCHTNLGKKSEALLVYKRCKKILSMVLGIEPSKETQKLYQSIIKGG